jgi:hypothetical protein
MRKGKILYLFFMLFFFGCAPTLFVTPRVEQVECKNFQIKGKIDYNGKKENLPRVISEEAISDSKITFRYVHDYRGVVTSESHREFNPFSGGLLGYLIPKTRSNYKFSGELEVLKEGESIKAYKATVSSSRQEGYFSEKERSEMDDRGLVEIRNNIEAQICHDKDFLLKNLMQ